MPRRMSCPAENAKRLSPAYPFSFALLCFVLTVYAELSYVFMLGFPDNFIAELEAAEEKLAIWFERISLVMCVWFIYLGIAAFRNQVTKRVMYSIFFYMLLISVVLAIDVYFQGNLMDSRGG
jgi:hypothetical protein